jgi:purine-binding chemotaxis protein CheW
MIVDSVKEVIDLQDSQIEPAPSLGNHHALSFVRGMGKVDNHVVILVDIESAFTFEQMNVMAGFNQEQAA